MSPVAAVAGAWQRVLGPRTGRVYRVIAIALTLFGLALVVVLWLHGRSYYRLPPVERIDHPQHERLRASGLVGHGYGIVGTFLIVLNLLYFVRKHARILRGRGNLRAWMEVHVFAGLLGSALILFHSAFQVRNQVASAASWSLVILVGTGLLGRYMYGLLPRSESGEEQKDGELSVGIGDLRRELALAAGESALARDLFQLITPAAAVASVGPLAALGQLALLPARRVRGLLARRRVARRLAAAARLSNDDRLWIRGLAIEIERREAQRRAIVLFRDLFVWWRALHRAFAFVMVAAMLVHVGVALYYGYRWIF